MSVTKSSGAVLGSPVEFTFEGVDYSFRLFDFEAVGKIAEKLEAKVKDTVPDLEEAKQLCSVAPTAEAFASAVDRSIQLLHEMRQNLSDIGLDDVLGFVGSTSGLAEALSICGGIEIKEAQMLLVRSRHNIAARAHIRRWMLKSGLISDAMAKRGEKQDEKDQAEAEGSEKKDGSDEQQGSQ